MAEILNDSLAQAVNPARLGMRLRLARQTRGMTLKALADAANCSESLLSKIENGKSSPSLPMLHRLVGALDTNIGWMFEESDGEEGIVFRAGSLVSGTNFMEIMEVRLRIEPQLAQLAALRANDADIDRMRDLRDKIYERADADWRELWDGSLHRLIAQTAGNQLFLSLFDVINRVRQDAVWQSVRERARNQNKTLNESRDQHTDIIEAIASRDPARAGEAMRIHLLTLQERLIRQTSMDFPDRSASVEETDSL